MTAEQVAAEARRVPESGLDIDTLYRNLLVANPEFAGPLASAMSPAGPGSSDYSEMFT